MSNGHTRWSNFKFNSKRLWVDVCVLLSLLLIGLGAPAAWFPLEAKIGFISLFLSKLTFVSAGLIHSHLARKVLFPYIDFKESKDPFHKALVIALYVLITFCWARGG